MLTDGDGKEIGHISMSPASEKVLHPLSNFYCYKCRHYELHQLMRVPATGYYDAEYWWKCSRCDEDNRSFPT